MNQKIKTAIRFVEGSTVAILAAVTSMVGILAYKIHKDKEGKER